ncbi:hypothetical protein F5Y01DRAFT_325881 [Xylaria sp. FL0043]|nr:hypothetical protein F5Y01DRAFT_325881 [Xylaria sp. FL0043]
MADPVGVAGTAVGIVSLGLQVYGALNQYLDDFNSRDERVTKTLAYLKQLKEALDVIDAAAQSFQTRQQAPANTVLSCLHSCQAEMNALQEKIQGFRSSPQSSVKGKIKEINRKLRYPFDISSVEEMEKSLERIIAQLSLAIYGLELNSQLAVSTDVAALGSSIKSQTDVLAKMKLEADANQKVNAANIAHLTSIGMSVQPLGPMIQTLESVTSDRLDKFAKQISTNHSVTTSRLDVLESRAEANAQAMTEIVHVLRHIHHQPHSRNEEHVGRRFVGALVSKPGLLRDLHESYEVQQESIGSNSKLEAPNCPSRGSARRALPLSKPCGCSAWRSVDERVTRWRTLYFFSKEVVASTHHPRCSRYASGASQRQRTFGMTYAGLRRLLSAAVSVSLCLDYGAGGISMSPMFRYHYVVDELQSLPFRMLIVLLYGCNNYPHIGADIARDFLLWVRKAYDKQVASPRDVTINSLSLIDYLCYQANFQGTDKVLLCQLLPELLDLGLTAMTQDSVRWILSPHGRAPDITRIGHAVCLILQNNPRLQHQYRARTINFLVYGDVIGQFSEISTKFDLDPLCTALLHKDPDYLLQILTTDTTQDFRSDKYRLRKSLIELAVRWPIGLSHILALNPCFFTSADMDALFERATLTSYRRCRMHNGTGMCYDCDCSGATEILLKYGHHLTERSLSETFHSGLVSTRVVYTILQHLGLWRERLWGALQAYVAVESLEEPAVTTRVLDCEAISTVKKLQQIGADPYELFGLQHGDYRLGSSRSIFHIIPNYTIASVAFDLGFRDVDVPSAGVTPLSKAIGDGRLFLHHLPGYYWWLIDHGADYTRELPWTVAEQEGQGLGTVNLPRYRVLHWLFRLPYRLKRYLHRFDIYRYVSIMTKSPWASQFAQSNQCDGCLCACLSSSQGCSPLVIFLNQMVRDRCSITDLINYVNTLAEAIEKFYTPVESIIRCITFNRLGIRHTCCASIEDYTLTLPVDYGSDFDELREEDRHRVYQLDKLVADFMEQYENSGLSLSDFISGPWVERMSRLKREEESKEWTAEERDMLLSIGVLPKHRIESVEELDNEKEDEDEDEDEGEGEDDMDPSRPEYWNKQFEIIVNGGRSIEEPSCHYSIFPRRN